MYSELSKATTEDTIWRIVIIQVAVYITRAKEGARKAMKRENPGWWVELLAMARFTGIKREGRGCEVYTEDGKEVTGWQILSQYKGIKNTRFVVRDTKGSASPLNSEADCSSVS